MPRRGLRTAAALALTLALAGCATLPDPAPEPSCADPAAAPSPARPPAPACDNDALTRFAGLLVLAPHPDDEVLGFAGLVDAYHSAGKPVEVVVVTDGDAYCEACSLWKSGAIDGATCDALDLSNLATSEIDSFAEVRHAESRAAAAILEAPAPEFLGYPDTGLAAAWSAVEAGEPGRALRRSDFSACESCSGCDGYGAGPSTELSAATLTRTLRERLEAVPPGTLVATTHWLDGHGDHAALGRFVTRLAAELDRSPAAAYAVIHAHTPHETPHPDCWYPAPRALDCACADAACARADPTWLTALRSHRLRPEWPAALPDDADYGEEVQLCLPAAQYRGPGASKLAAVGAYRSQLGFAARQGELPPALGGLIDCSGYLLSFVRSTEAFVLVDPDARAGSPLSPGDG